MSNNPVPLNSLEFLDINGAANFLSLKVSKLRADVFYKRIPYFKLGRLIRFSKTDLLKWLEQHSVRID